MHVKAFAAKMLSIKLLKAIDAYYTHLHAKIIWEEAGWLGHMLKVIAYDSLPLLII